MAGKQVIIFQINNIYLEKLVCNETISSARRLDRPPIIEMTDKDVLNAPGHEWAIFRLGTTSTIVAIEIDTNHFKGNAPEYVTIEGTLRRGDFETTFNDNDWTVILDKIKVQPHKLHSIKKEIKNTGPFNSVRITIAPDGGISRVRIFGQAFIEKIDKNGTAETNEHEEKNENNETPEAPADTEETTTTAEKSESVPSNIDQNQENSTSDK